MEKSSLKSAQNSRKRSGQRNGMVGSHSISPAIVRL